MDFEFIPRSGERPIPVCLVARELRSGQVIRMWQDELRRATNPPFEVGADDLFVAYYATAELDCFLALGWPLPVRVLDPWVEFKNIWGGIRPPAGRSLISALSAYGLPHIDAGEKTAMRDLILSGGPWSADDRQAILDYCHRL